MSDIPSHLIEDILSRLPVKDLCRFRCVSKPWKYLTKDPWFVKLHLSRSHKQRLLLQRIFVQEDNLHTVELATISCLRDSVPVEIEIPGITLDSFAVIGSCNGLLCIQIQEGSICFLLCNPTTKECETIQDEIVQGNVIGEVNPTTKACETILEEIVHGNVIGEVIGFGYVESIDDYKIVKLPWTETGGSKFGEVKVYSVKNREWKSIRSYLEFGFGFEGHSISAYVNGAVHFVVYYKEDNEKNECRTMIVAFDLKEDELKAFHPPDFILTEAYRPSVTDVGHLGGCLCVLNQTGSRIELWIMKEYGVAASWTKLIKTDELLPSCYLNNNQTKLVIVQPNKLMVWDSEDGLKHMKVTCINGNWRIENLYMESLVSPNSINQEDEQLFRFWYG